MRLRTLVCVLLIAPTLLAGDKFQIEVVSVTEHVGPTVTSVMYTAKIILPDGSHALGLCGALSVCELDGGYPERLKKTYDKTSGDFTTTGYPKLEAKRKGNVLTIFTRTGKREYNIMDSW